MALSDALLELTTRWDDELARVFDDAACERLQQGLDDAIREDHAGPLADVVAMVADVVGRHDPFLEALDRPRFRHGDSTPDLPGCRFVADDATSWDRPPQSTDETFLALVLRNRLADRDGPSRTRVTARRTTLTALIEQPLNAGPALIRAVSVLAAPAPPMHAALGQLVAFDPAEAFLELPAHLRTRDTVSRLRLSTRLVPGFQLFARSPLTSDARDDVAGQVNALLDAANDPWGVASWWVTLSHRYFGGGRFDATLDDQYPFVYAGDSMPGAVAETLLRDAPIDHTGAITVPRVNITGCKLSALTVTADLEVVDLTGLQALRQCCQDTWLVQADPPDYPRTRHWGHWIRTQAKTAAGFMWLSKRDPTRYSFVLFGERCPPGSLSDSSAHHLSLPAQQSFDDPGGHAHLRRVLAPLNADIV